MNAEYLLDAIGFLDDALIQEAEQYTLPGKRIAYGTWLAWAASFAVVLVLGYGAIHFHMGGKDHMSGGAASCVPSSSLAGEGIPDKDESPWPEPGCPGGGSQYGSNGEPESPGESSGSWLSAIRVDGTIYWATEEYVPIEPEADSIRYTTSLLHGAEPEEDGQTNFEPVGTAYVVLEDGRVAVLRSEEAGSWQIYASVPPWET